jgi:hypothetical protein
MQRTNVRHQRLNLIIAKRTLERVPHRAIFALPAIEDPERSYSFQPRNQIHLDHGTLRTSSGTLRCPPRYQDPGWPAPSRPGETLIVDVQIRASRYLSRSMLFPFLNCAIASLCVSSLLRPRGVSLGRVLRSAGPSLACPLQRKLHCKTPR